MRTTGADRARFGRSRRWHGEHNRYSVYMTSSTDLSPALAASQASWRAVQSHDKDAWLALMADDVVIEDPIGKSYTNPEGTGVRGKDAVSAFYDANIAKNNLRIECEETFLSSSPEEVAHILFLRSEFEGALRSEVRGVFTYRVNESGLVTNLRGYWTLEAMTFSKD